ncbi:MarR family winged helix-turn-helix transcriptional regulator [Uliginosibacterium sp. sgz301328]|uniref:MarR family winged helix-turn-helix transcriptional regulator n=1 Tax=Uliginosibacterium sp. sgz301328 TaxID=3243764 RepID=UPI00359D45D3
MSDKPDSVESPNTQSVAVDLRVLVGKLRRKLREAADTQGLNDAQRSALMHLEREGTSTVTAMAQAEGMRSQSMGAIVTVLMDAGLVSGAPDPTDGRRTLLSLTSEARKYIRQLRAAREDWLVQSIQSKFSATEQKQLARGVDLLKRLVE